MHFENPFALIGLLGALIPLIIHLFDRRQAKPIPFAALDFILKTNKKLSRSLKWKQWLILLARILLISAIPFAFSQPFLAEDSGQATLSETPMSVVFVVDNSVSMGRTDTGGSTALDEAKERVITLMENLSGESNIAIVEGSGSCESRQSELSFDRQAVLASLNSLEVSDARGEPLRAFQVAEALLAQSQLPDKRVIVVSDFQESNWKDIQSPWSLTLHLPSNLSASRYRPHATARLWMSLFRRLAKSPLPMFGSLSKRGPLARRITRESDPLPRGQDSGQFDPDSRGRNQILHISRQGDGRYTSSWKSRSGSRHPDCR